MLHPNVNYGRRGPWVNSCMGPGRGRVAGEQLCRKGLGLLADSRQKHGSAACRASGEGHEHAQLCQ